MSFSIVNSKQDGQEQLERLVEAYHAERSTYRSSDYNEAQTRSDFIDPLLKCFGWDVNNSKGNTYYLRDVIQEESIAVDDDSNKKMPDYTLRVDGIRKIFVEAKKPSVNISESKESAFQIRRYGWNANLGISILANFDQLIIYDCRHRPDPEDDEHIARVKVIDYDELVTQFEELYDLISYEAVVAGRIEDQFSNDDFSGQTFDKYFLKQIEDWRHKLAISAIESNEQVNNRNINFLIQRLLNRIIFLRICEDRAIEEYETIKSASGYDDLKQIFLDADRKYNSGLFGFIEDTLSLEISINSKVLIEIFNELYYPLSPYDFSVIDSSILSQIYEKFLGSELKIESDGQLNLVQQPEVMASNGVVPTPKFIVEQIVKNTINPLLAEKRYPEYRDIKIADICCGSGTFLITVYEQIQRNIIDSFYKNLAEKDLAFESADGAKKLTLKAKKRILLNNIYGVDLNPYAVEVTKFSLLLMLLEDESSATVDSYLSNNDEEVLPNLSGNIKCGNSLVDDNFYEFAPDSINDDDKLRKLNIFNWEEEFDFINEDSGFDAIVGNPPYVRIQKLVEHQHDEIKFYQSKEHGFEVAKNQTIDKYYVFIQKAISLLSSQGFLGYIVPHKFFIVKGGKALRKFITNNISLRKVYHFGVNQVFPGRATYTAILVFQKGYDEKIKFKKIPKVAPKYFKDDEEFVEYEQSYIGAKPWVFVSEDVKEVFSRFEDCGTTKLSELADITVGLQTSADDIYIFQPSDETDSNFILSKDGESWEIEKSICLPCIHDLSFSLFDTIGANKQIIFPYDICDGHADLIPESEMISNYPSCWEYLEHHKEKLKNRSFNGSDPVWYQFGRSQSLSKFHDKRKLIWPVLSREPSYILDNDDLQFTGGGNGPYYSLINRSDYSIHYLMGILSHPIIESMIKSRSSEFRGAYYSHGKQFMKNLPIKIIDFNNEDETELYQSIVKDVEKLIETRKSVSNAYGQNKTIQKRKFNYLKRSMTASINKLYNITEEDVQRVLEDEMLSTELLAEV
jgi:tRNA1(Val) A37 N6-methylase TrmN6